MINIGVPCKAPNDIFEYRVEHEGTWEEDSSNDYETITGWVSHYFLFYLCSSDCENLSFIIIIL